MYLEDLLDDLDEIEKKMLGSRWSFKDVMKIVKRLESIGRTAIHCYDKKKDEQTR